MKSVLVVGHKGLIGRAVCAQLKKDGFAVFGADLPEYNCVYAEDFGRAYAMGRPGVVVNCAYPRDVLDHFSLCLTVAGVAARFFETSGGGVVISIASIYGLVGPQDDLYAGTEMEMPDWYSFAKGGIIAHTRTLAARYGPRVRVNSVSPGGVEDGQPAEFVERYCNRTPLGRMATAQNVADAVSFLASDKAEYITGHNLVVDGGWTCR